MSLRRTRRLAAVLCLPFAALLPIERAQALQLKLTQSLEHTADIATPIEDNSGTVNVEASSLTLRASESLQSPQGSSATRIVNAALGMLGTTYRFGRESFDAVDCSGLIQRIFGSAGHPLPRTAQEMLASGRAVDRDTPQKGDLLFYRWKQRQLHVAIYVDDNTIVHASPAAGRVVATPLTPDWQRHLVAVRRVL